MFADIDNFKNINDTHGHSMGDQVIINYSNRISDILSETKNPLAFAGRMGGEEFLIVLGNYDAIKTKEFIKTLRSITSKVIVDTNNSLPISYTASYGIALYPDDAASCNGLILRADELMYIAKKSGKDRAISSSDLIKEQHNASV